PALVARERGAVLAAVGEQLQQLAEQVLVERVELERTFERAPRQREILARAGLDDDRTDDAPVFACKTLTMDELPAVVVFAAEERTRVERERPLGSGLLCRQERGSRQRVGERLEREAVDPDEARVEAEATGVDRDRGVVAEQAAQPMQRDLRRCVGVVAVEVGP